MKINLSAPINSLGYGRASLEILNSLYKAGHSVSLFPINERIEPNLITEAVKKSLDNAELFDYIAPSVRIWHQNSLAPSIGSGPRIGFPIFELDRFTDVELHHLKSCDYLFVCSKWAREICIGQGFEADRVFVVPLGVDTNLFSYVEPTHKDCRFFNIGKWEIRKGHDILLEAFKEEFKNDDNVTLFMCCSNPFLTDSERSIWESKAKHPKIRLVQRLPEHSDVAKLIKSCDCGVFPARAEGWNLEALETLACGRALITTNYSAHTEFCKCKLRESFSTINSFLIPVSGTEPAMDNKWFHGQGNWAKFDSQSYDRLKSYMRLVYTRKMSGVSVSEVAISNSVSHFTWDNTVQTMIGHLNGIINPR